MAELKCTHKEKITLSLGSLWGPFEAFCAECGVCTSNKKVAANLEGVRKSRQLDAELAVAAEHYDSMTAEEKQADRKELIARLKAGRKELAEQLKSFSRPHNCLRRCHCHHRRL